MYNRAVLLNLPKSQSIDIEFTDLVYSIQCGFRGPNKDILKEISGTFKCGDMTAIMGPSGAGKSSLLNLLTGFHREKNLKGTIKYSNSKGNRQTWDEYRKQSCYILQDDQLHGLFTVNEAMAISTDLKLGVSLNRKAKQMLIDDILETLDLTKSKDTRCDKLSGGQKKRLSIALELVDNPPVMFLDEPTSGLDSSSSLQCIAMLQCLARGGRTIICTIHQPSAAIYEMFDHVYLLAEGRCMYEGSPMKTVEYFSSLGLCCPKYHNPADYMIEVVTKEHGDFNDQLAAVMENDRSIWRAADNKTLSILDNNINRRYSDEGKTTVLINTPSEVTRFWILLNRCFVQLYRDWTVTHLKVIVHFLVGVLLGLLFENAGAEGSKSVNNIGFYLVSVVYLCYTSMMPAVLKFPLELAVLKKEQFNNWYKLKTYYVALLIANLPVQFLFAIVYTSVSYFLSNQPLDWNRFLMFLAISILTTFIAESQGLLLGTLLSPVNGTFFGAITTCAYLVFAGFLILFNHMPRYLYYCSYFSYLRYALDGLVQATYGFNREKLNCSSENIYCHYRIPEVLLNELAMSNGKYWLDITVLVVNFVFFRTIAYCTLKKKLSTT
ncbi:hypothetical protein KPH14_001917 [Odynerus spinipes]|uniref:ABC transporter domain-containing protein n=1 Tax=Odynerus spinipes TaxID=1348599 RepID=A0AAD9S275_9HYME|nr:hypothetical protein KPH14_001917 [Odynerus spinipes]